MPDYLVDVTDFDRRSAGAHAGLVVLHYDTDYGRISEVGGADHEWVVPKGSV